MSLSDLFKKKEKWSSDKCGQFLAHQFSKRIIENYNDGKLLYLHLSSCTSDKSTLLQEWIIFEMFLMVNGVSAFFKGSSDSFQILDYFHSYCHENFKQVGVFSEDFDFSDLLKSRYTSYSKALKETKQPGGLHWVSKKVLSNLNCNDKDIAEIMAISLYYTKVSIAYKKLIADLMKSIKIVD